jgi:hypothetical protein
VCTGKNLAIGVAQKIAADPARPDLLALRRRPVFDSVEIGGAAQHVVVFEFVDREVFRAALQRHISPGA